MNASPRLLVPTVLVALVGIGGPGLPTAMAQVPDLRSEEAPPLRQSDLDPTTAGPPRPLSVLDASRDDRWLGVGVEDVRWHPDGRWLYFRWHPRPTPEDDPADDPWFQVDPEGTRVVKVPDEEVHLIPAASPSWSADGSRAAWSQGGRLYLYDADDAQDESSGPGAHGIRPAYVSERPIGNVRMRGDGSGVEFTLGQDLFSLELASGTVRQRTRIHRPQAEGGTEFTRWLRGEQFDLFEHIRRQELQERRAQERAARLDPLAPQPLPIEEGASISGLQLSPDGEFVTFRWTRQHPGRSPTVLLDYVTASGYSEVIQGRPKAGGPWADDRFGIVRVDRSAPAGEVSIHWIELPEAGGEPVVIHGPYWSLEGDRAALQAFSRDHKDRWIALLDLETGETEVIDHQRDDAWVAGPDPVGGRLRPGLLEWLPGGQVVFASEASGWSHLYLAEPHGEVRALTSGEWEVRGARLTRDRERWILATSEADPTEDHLYEMPAAGGDRRRITTSPGRHTGHPSPRGDRLAVIHSETVQLPDLFLLDLDAREEDGWDRITVSGTDNFHRHRWVRPEMERFLHTDGGPLWAAVFRPEEPNPERAAVIHIHGGGYRQFAHRGWSVYGYHMHIGAIQYLVQEGYTVLDFDYRGSSGFGRDYRTDVYRAMGEVDIDGAVTAVDWLVENEGIDRGRIGIYGLSVGGYFTLMALFRHPGVFAAGIANVGPTDWAHDSEWPTPILNLPHEDPEAYRRASPIYHSEALEDPLLIVHGMLDDNVHLQDAIRLVQRLIEQNREFETMYYPVEEHVIANEDGRFDYTRRLVDFFDRHLRR